jgi:hypothetical protein
MGRPAKPDPRKTCDQCGSTMTRKRINGRLEDMGTFLRRRYCDQQCMAAAFVKDAPSHWDTFHSRARKKRRSCCESCGGTTRLHAHHIDGDRTNNSDENIQTLCVHCHVTHHHRARRAGLTVAGRMVLPV